MTTTKHKNNEIASARIKNQNSIIVPDNAVTTVVNAPSDEVPQDEENISFPATGDFDEFQFSDQPLLITDNNSTSSIAISDQPQSFSPDSRVIIRETIRDHMHYFLSGFHSPGSGTKKCCHLFRVLGFGSTVK